jgi:serine/threonine-protein kinase
MSMIGRTLGHYQITSQLGKGGMGEVYQAKDLTLGRDVAIKVLPEEFARDADRVARFQREAKVLASLNHPNIAAIYGLEEANGTNFLVLELVEGETLADRIKAGRIPVEESLKLALQIAEALEAAHEKGVIHRDLKPANIKVTPDGKVKVLDFGLAKAFAGEHSELNLSNSPTLSNAATQQGVILGTAAYMSPEQARGKAVDKRADIWAFGCVLYEMLTGQASFQGEDITEILASVVKGGANLDLLPANLHPRVREVITRCMQKDLRRRYSSITDARYEIEQALADPGGVLVTPLASTEHQSKLRLILPWVAATVVVAAIIVGVAVWKLKPTLPAEPRQVIRLDYELPEDQQFSSLFFPILAVSPDGKQFVYSTSKGLYLRSLDELTAKLIAGTEESTGQPFFSPDGKWVGYYSVADRKLKKIAIKGGASVALCDVEALAGASWAADNTIVFGQRLGGIMRISANGGTPKEIFKAERERFAFPQILPDGKSVLYTSLFPPKIMVRSLKSGESKELFAGSCARYLPTGHMVYAMGNNLLAIPFDPGRLETAGGPVPIVEGVFSTVIGQQYVLSDSGTLVYMPGIAPALAQRTLVWVDRSGKEEPLAAPPNQYHFPNISPDETRIALSVETAEPHPDIWVWDLVHKSLTRLTFEGRNMTPVWSPDGKRIAFYSTERTGAKNGIGVYWKAADGTRQDEQIGFVTEPFSPFCWSSDGKTLIGEETPDIQRSDIALLSMEGDHVPKPLLTDATVEKSPRISPDGGWIAYTSNGSRQDEIYVRSFPDVNKGRWQISTSGGNNPLWSPDGHELFYLSGNAVMAVSVTTKPTFNIIGTPRVLFRGTYVRPAPGVDGTSWDISQDGKRFLMMREAGSTAGGPRKINVVVNWFEELRQRVPVK